MTTEEATELRNFWFGDGKLDDPGYVGTRMKMWFGKAPELDAKVNASFAGWLDRPIGESRLSEIILHDQIPRNAFRDQAKMFAYDEIALKLAHQAITEGLNKSLHPVKTIFLLLPFEHSELLKDQDLCLKLNAENHARAPEAIKPITASTFDYAKKHRAVIERFGRFPHRNQILGRESTPAELEFLKQPGSRF